MGRFASGLSGGLPLGFLDCQVHSLAHVPGYPEEILSMTRRLYVSAVSIGLIALAGCAPMRDDAEPGAEGSTRKERVPVAWL